MQRVSRKMKRSLGWASASAVSAAAVLASAVPASGAKTPTLHIAPSMGVPHGEREAVGTLRVLSLNVAHGRANGSNQLLQRDAHRRATLAQIGALLAREAPHVVGLQELDGPSFWSGSFSHLEALASHAGFSFAVHGEHVAFPFLRYGTGLLSHRELKDAVAYTVAPSPPTFSKGFTLATVEVAPGRDVDVVSVHLDFASAKVRARQIDEMLGVLSEREHPLVVMGDFNAEWDDEGSAVRVLAERLGLDAHAPERVPAEVATFPGASSRIDWILVSPSLTFERYEVLDDVVSDHLAIVADVRLR